ncbi:hypothetical protein [Pedobacter borealis]|uniref:hypothetical protein n=1 Tax=Pedobacter borealis TaxID=475254 RepID=UPI000AAAF2A7|nr:hypothetical protein [Pedobacter borealis]
MLTRKESQKLVPNYFIKNLILRIADQPITNFTNPYPSLEGITKQKISYKRADGVDLTGDLYLPKGYNKDKDGPLPSLSGLTHASLTPQQMRHRSVDQKTNLLQLAGPPPFSG